MAYALYNIPTDNVAPNATVTLGSPDSSYPVTYAANLTDAYIARPSKSTLATDAWVFDFGAAQRVDLVVIWHNFDASLACSWQGNATNSWGSPTLSQALTVQPKREDGFTMKIYADVRTATNYTTGGFRYWRLNVTGTNSVPLGIKIWIGQLVRKLDRPIEQSLHFPEHHQHIELVTDGQARWIYDMIVAPRIYSGTINCSQATLAALKTWTRTCGHRVKPSVLIPSSSGPEAMIVRWMPNPSTSLPTGGGVVSGTLDPEYYNPASYPVQVAWDEVSAGAPEWL